MPKRNPNYPRMLPAELAVANEQLARSDGRFRFGVSYRVYSLVFANGVRIRKPSLWSAGSMEELLHAMTAAEMAMEACPGVKREKPSRGAVDNLRCIKCGTMRRKGHGHTAEECRATLKTATARFTAVSSLGHAARYGWPKDKVKP